jgi:hypothetical protein
MIYNVCKTISLKCLKKNKSVENCNKKFSYLEEVLDNCSYVSNKCLAGIAAATTIFYNPKEKYTYWKD